MDFLSCERFSLFVKKKRKALEANVSRAFLIDCKLSIINSTSLLYLPSFINELWDTRNW